VVELEIARVHDQPDRRAHGQTHTVGDRVADIEKVNGKGAQGERGIRADGPECHIAQPVLAQLDLNQALCEGGCIDWGPDLFQQVRKRTGVVLVAMGDDDAPDMLAPLEHVAHIGNDDIYPQHLILGKHEAGVDDNQVVVVLQHHHVTANLAQAAQGDDAHLAVCQPNLRENNSQ